jgi:L-ascorbate 6-phosphate lactonase
MQDVLDFRLEPDLAALWFLGQSGFLLRAGGIAVAIDPYLSDSVKAVAPEFARRVPVPLDPRDLRVDVFVVTHNHFDHLDPETIRPYGWKDSTTFIAPRLASLELLKLGVPSRSIRTTDVGQQTRVGDLLVDGVFAVPTGADVLDTTGYHFRFPNGRTVCHLSDTSYSPLLAATVPKGVEVLLVPINGKWGNLTVEQAADVTAAAGPRYVVPHHYDMMALNSENPESFRWFCRQRNLSANCMVLDLMTPFVWDEAAENVSEIGERLPGNEGYLEHGG